MFRTADGERRSCSAITLTTSPCWASSRSRLISLFDHGCTPVARVLGRKEANACVDMRVTARYFIVGIEKSDPPRLPASQRQVTVFSRV